MTGHHGTRRGRLLIAAAAIAVMTVTACEADVRTHITPQRGDTAAITVTVTATAELAELFRNDPDSASELASVIADAAGERPARDDDGETITWTTSTDIDAVTSSAGVSGISDIEVSDDGETTTVTVGEPTRLTEAIAGLEDPAGALAAGEQTRIAVEVHYPGGVTGTEATEGVAAVAVSDTDDTTARWGWPATRPAEGTITVTGNPDAPRNWLIIGGVAVAVAAALGMWLRRRVNRAATTPSAHRAPRAPQHRS